MALSTTAIVASSSFLIFTECLILFGNVLVILAVFKNKTMQTVTNFLIVNLSITDLLVAIFNCPLMLVAILAKGWIIGDVMCTVSGFLNVVFCCASILTLTAISIDRYFCITRPTKTVITKRKAIYMIIFIWFVVMGFAIMPIIGWNKYVYIDDRKHCMILWQMGGKHSAYGIFLSVSSFVIPTWIMIFCYFKIFSTARNQAKKFKHTNISNAAASKSASHAHSSKVSPLVTRATWIINTLAVDELTLDSLSTGSLGEQEGQQDSRDNGQMKTRLTIDATREKAERKTARVILIVIGVFQVCWLPYAALNQWSAFSGNPPPAAADLGASLLAYFNSGCNAVIYTIFNNKFRQGFKKLLTCKRKITIGRTSRPLRIDVQTRI